MTQHTASWPVAGWAKHYNSQVLMNDLVAAVIVAIMLIPQSLAYAMLAGLPPEVGLYASIFPLIAYALLGTSSTLSVGPVAITSLMTAAALAEVAEQGSGNYLSGAITLAALSGLMLLALRLMPCSNSKTLSPPASTPSRYRTWLRAMIIADAVMKADTTVWERKLARNPSRKTPNASSMRPDNAARVIAPLR